MDSLETDTQQMLITVKELFVRMVEHVWMELTAMSAVVQMDSRGIIVRVNVHLSKLADFFVFKIKMK